MTTAAAAAAGSGQMLGPDLTRDLAELPVHDGSGGSAGQASATQGAHERIQSPAPCLGGPRQQIRHTGLPLHHHIQLHPQTMLRARESACSTATWLRVLDLGYRVQGLGFTTCPTAAAWWGSAAGQSHGKLAPSHTSSTLPCPSLGSGSGGAARKAGPHCPGREPDASRGKEGHCANWGWGVASAGSPPPPGIPMATGSQSPVTGCGQQWLPLWFWMPCSLRTALPRPRRTLLQANPKLAVGQ